MGILVNNVAILKSAGLGFIRVADQVDRFGLVRFDKTPFYPARKTSTTAAAEAGCFYLVNNFFPGHLDRFFQLLVPAIFEIAVDINRPIRASDIFENETALQWMGRGKLIRCY